MQASVIVTSQLTRRYKRLTAVEGVELQVPQGSVYGFLGPNGAGKTTTIRMLLGLLHPDAGQVSIFGKPLNQHRRDIIRRVGSLVEMPSLYPHLTGQENLEVMRRMTGGARTAIARALAIVNLERDANRVVREYSLGMRQRLGLAMAFLGQPELLILDEPTNGLDPEGIREIRELLCSLAREQGLTIFLSSHLLSEVEHMATHIGIIDKGKLIFQGTPDELCARYRDHLTLVTDRLDESRGFLTRQGWQVRHNGNNHLTIQVNGRSDAALINAQLVRAGMNVYQLALEQPSLENIFLSLTGSTVKTEEER